MFWRRKAQEPAPAPEERLHELLSAYLDDELSASEQAEAESLIASDPVVRAEFDELSRMVSAFGNLGAEVRAPRSFAIAAPSANTAPGAPLALFQRVEVFFRASAAATALLFVVVLMNGPSADTPVTAPSAAMTSADTSTAETLMLPADAARTGEPAPAFAPSTAAVGESGETGETDNGAMGALALPEEGSGAGGSAAADGTPEDRGAEAAAGTMSAAAPAEADQIEIAPASAPGGAMGGATGPVDQLSGEGIGASSGTESASKASDPTGGMAPALGTIAGLLTALSALLAWNRRDRQP